MRLKEEGVMAAGTGGFTNTAAATGPVAGFDPVQKLRAKVKKKIMKRTQFVPLVRGVLGDSY